MPDLVVHMRRMLRATELVDQLDVPKDKRDGILAELNKRPDALPSFINSMEKKLADQGDAAVAAEPLTIWCDGKTEDGTTVLVEQTREGGYRDTDQWRVLIDGSLVKVKAWTRYRDGGSTRLILWDDRQIYFDHSLHRPPGQHFAPTLDGEPII